MLPSRAKPGEAEVTVRSRVRQPGVEPVFIDYDMEKNGTAWKVYDIRGLIGTLAAKNRS